MSRHMHRIGRISMGASIGVLYASAALAGGGGGGCPDPATSAVPPCIRLVGHNDVTADPEGLFTVTVLDAESNPVSGAAVFVSFLHCNGARICQAQLDPGVDALCPSTAFLTTDNAGTATVSVIGCGVSGSCTEWGHCAEITASKPGCDVVSLGFAPVTVFDLDGGGMSGTDLSTFLQLFFDCSYDSRIDYDCDGTESGNDLSEWLAVFFAGRSTLGCDTIGSCCP